jgi:hypothetical protein
MVTYLDIWWAWYQWMMETLYETRALRECHNINVVRLDRIEKALKEQGIQ